jgi:hypothetical protein
MITLRRYPSPVLDNLSSPKKLDKNSDGYYSEGVMRPVAQVITWFGGNTGNSLNDLISFSTGIQWDYKPQDPTKTQEAFSKGFLQDGIINDIRKGLNYDVATNVFSAGEIITTGAVVGTDPNETLTRGIRVAGLRDKAKNQGGLMSEYIWTSVDVVKNTYVRGVGLTFDWKSISVVFDYELTSVGEVNTKAAMLDILGNILSIGTNYGVFLTPDTRYNSAFPAVRFPGGDAGLELYYRDPIGWLSLYSDKISKIIEDAASGDGDGTQGQAESQKVRQSVDKIAKDGSKSDSESSNFFKQFLASDEASRILKFQQSANFIENYQMPLSFLTGAPIGEWHLTIGNPCNPIAMIGNLVCTNVKIDFTEILGPDDFPTGVKATFTLEHGRDRERGEIESIFNRGDGRLYHSAQETSSDQQSFSSFADVAGNVLSYDSPGSLQDGFWNSQLNTIPDQLGPNN